MKSAEQYPREEWDLLRPEMAQEEYEFCLAYELARESDWACEAIKRIRKNESSRRTRRGRCEPLTPGTPERNLRIFLLACPEFPDQPWLRLRPEERARRVQTVQEQLNSFRQDCFVRRLEALRDLEGRLRDQMHNSFHTLALRDPTVLRYLGKDAYKRLLSDAKYIKQVQDAAAKCPISSTYVFCIQWWMKDSRLLEEFAAFLKRRRPTGSQPLELRGLTSFRDQLKALGAYRLYRHFKRNFDRVQLHLDHFGASLYSHQSKFIAASKRTEDLLNEFDSLNNHRLLDQYLAAQLGRPWWRGNAPHKEDGTFPIPVALYPKDT